MGIFKIRRKRKLPKGYFREKEIDILRERHKGKLPVSSVVKEGHRFVSQFPRKTHRVNQLVIYKGKEYVVRDVSQKGVHLSKIKSDEGLLGEVKLGKEKFVPEKKYSGNAVPVEAQIIFGL